MDRVFYCLAFWLFQKVLLFESMLPELNTDFNFNFANQIADHEQEEDVEF